MQPILVDSKLRKAEDARLRATYKKVDKQLVKAEKKSLDKATDLLMKHSDLAWQLLASQGAVDA
jgi:AmiR/NasT family two-component response regulator